MNRSSTRQAHCQETNCLERKRRVLKVACQLFARHGFEGTHVREVCNLAGVNIALVCYHFRDKQGLYEAVRAEARKRLSRRSSCNLASRRDLTPESQLQAIIKSLFARLSGDSAWIIHLVARELAEEIKTPQATVGEGFRADLERLESAIREAVGPEADANTIRLDALNVLSQCLFYCAAKRALTRFSPQLDQQGLKPPRIGAPHQSLFVARLGRALKPKGKPMKEPLFMTRTGTPQGPKAVATRLQIKSWRDERDEHFNSPILTETNRNAWQPLNPQNSKSSLGSARVSNVRCSPSPEHLGCPAQPAGFPLSRWHERALPSTIIRRWERWLETHEHEESRNTRLLYERQ